MDQKINNRTILINVIKKKSNWTSFHLLPRHFLLLIHLHLHTFWLVLKTTEKFYLVVGRVKIGSFNFVSIKTSVLEMPGQYNQRLANQISTKQHHICQFVPSPDKPIMVKLQVVSLIFLGIVECKLIFLSSLNVSFSGPVAIDFQTPWRISSAYYP